MGLAKLKLPVALALVGMAFFVTFMQVKANEDTDDPVSSSAIWNPENNDLAEITQACNSQPAPAYNKCFIDQMGGYASSEAVMFSQALAGQSPGRIGYLSELGEAGPIDLGLVTYPNSTELRRGWVLVNGVPAIVDADNLKILPLRVMEKDPQYTSLRLRYPQLRLTVMNDDRRSGALPEMHTLGNGSQQFVIYYSLKEPCESCQPVAHASFGFNFDPSGRFLGVKFIRVVPGN